MTFFFPYSWKLRFRTKRSCQNAALWHNFFQKDTQDAKKKGKNKKEEFWGSAQDNQYMLLKTLIWLLRNAYSNLSQAKQEPDLCKKFL